MYNSVLKLRECSVQQAEARVIDTNELVAQRLEALSLKMSQRAQEAETEPEDELTEAEGEASFEDGEDGFQSLPHNVIKEADTEELHRKALEEANALLAEAQEKADTILEDAKAQRDRVLKEARQTGYEEGSVKARQELEQEKARLKEHQRQLEAEYEALAAKLEPEMVEHLTEIYEYLFHVDLSGNKEILKYLISDAMSRSESSKNFLLHVSKEDYSYVTSQKQQLLGVVTAEASLDIVEDLTLSRNECMIETDNGIIDCSLGTQLTELSKKLRLLSYQSR